MLTLLVNVASLHAGDGTWTATATGLWSEGANWSGGNVADGSGYTANFGAINITSDVMIHLDSARTIGNLTFGDTVTSSAAGWILDNNGIPANILTLAGGTPTITVNQLGTGKSATIGLEIAGTTGLTKAGIGTLILSGLNTYTGATTVSAGTLAYGANDVISTGAVTVNGGAINLGTYSDTVGTVTVNGGNITGSGTLTSTGSLEMKSGSVSAVLAGTGIILNKSTSGTVSLSGANTYTGGTNLSAGALNFTDGALGTTGNVVFTGNSTLHWNGTNTQDISDSGRLRINNSITATLDTGSNAVTLANNIGLNSDGTNSTGGMTKAGNGALILGAANTYTGATTVSAGTLAYGANDVISTGAVTVNGGALDLGTYSDTVGTVTVNGGNITGSGTLTSTGSLEMKSGSVSAVLAGAGIILSKSTSGTVTLSGANTYTGATIVSAGALVYGANDVISTGAVTVNGGALDLGTYTDTVGTVTVNGGSITGSGTLTSTGSFEMKSGSVSPVLAGAGIVVNKSTSGTATLLGVNTYTGGTNLSAGTLSFANGALGTTGNVVFTGNSTLQWNGTNSENLAGRLRINDGVTATLDTGSNAVTLANNIGLNGSGTNSTGGMTKAGNGTLILGAANTYTGATTVSAGTLAYGANDVISTGAVTVNGGAINLGMYSDTVGTVTVNGGSITGTGTLTSTGSFEMKSGSVSAVLAGTGIILNKSTSGTVSLSGANTYTGGTNLSAGALSFADGALGTTGNVVFTGNSTLHWNGTNTQDISDSGRLRINNSTTATLDTGSNAVTLAKNIGLNGGGTNSTGGMTKVGSGILTLRGDNTYTGPTIVNAGTLRVDSGSLLSKEAYIGSSSDATGVVDVSGAGSAWTNINHVFVGYSGKGLLNITNGGDISSDDDCYVGMGLGSEGIVTLNGTGSEFTCGTWSWGNGWFQVGYNGSGTVNITGGATLRSFAGGIGNKASATGVVTVHGPGSTWTNYGSGLGIGFSGTGLLNITGGGMVACTSEYGSVIGDSASGRGTVKVDGVGSTWTNDLTGLFIGLNGGSGTLSISGGGSVSAESVGIYSQSLLAIDVGRGSGLAVISGYHSANGTITNNGILRVVAGASPTTGAVFTPITAVNGWGGSGTYQAIGGTWDAGSHEFTTSATAIGSSGTEFTGINLASTQRALVSNGKGWSVGASFLAQSSTIDFTATAISDTTLTSLQSLLVTGDSVLSGWEFLADNYTVSETNPVYLSLRVGSGHSLDEVDLWQYNGTNWSVYTAPDLTYDGTYASFTVTGFAGYAVSGLAVPEPSAIILLSVGVASFLVWGWRQRKRTT